MKIFDKIINKSILAILFGGLISSIASAAPTVYIVNPSATMNQISVLDPTPEFPRWIKNFESGNYPRYLCVSPDNLSAYVSILNSAKIAIIDTSTSSEIGLIELRKDFTEWTPQQLAVSSDGKTLYVSGLNYDDALLATIDITSRTITKKLVLPNFQSSSNATHSAIPQALIVTPDGKEALVLLRSDSSDSGLAIVDLPNQKVLQVVKLAGVGHRMIMTLDGKKAYIPIHSPGYSPSYESPDTDGNDVLYSGDTMSSLVVFDTNTNTVKTTLPLVGTGDIALSSDGKKAYMVATDKITIIDTATDTVVGTVSLPNGKHHRIAITPDGKKSYITDYESQYGDLMLITDLQSQESTQAGAYGTSFAEGIAFLNPTPTQVHSPKTK